MSKLRFRERLRSGVPILGDGAMGTMLHERSQARADACFDAMNVDEPDVVLAVHQAYIEAGAEVVETNTFGANSFKLASAGRAGQVELYNRRGVELAKRAIAESARADVYYRRLGGAAGGGRLSLRTSVASGSASRLCQAAARADHGRRRSGAIRDLQRASGNCCWRSACCAAWRRSCRSSPRRPFITRT